MTSFIKMVRFSVVLLAVLVMGLGAGRADAGFFPIKWEADVNPTTLDSNSDGIGDWVVRGGAAFPASSLTTDGGLTVYAGATVGGKAVYLDTRPLYNATGDDLALEVKWKSLNTAKSVWDSFVWWNVDQTATDFGRLWAWVTVDGGNTVINTRVDGMFNTPYEQIVVSGTDYFVMRWEIDTVKDELAVWINDETTARATYTYTPVTGPTADSFATLGIGAGKGYIDYIHVVPEPATLILLGLGGVLALRRKRC